MLFYSDGLLPISLDRTLFSAAVLRSGKGVSEREFKGERFEAKKCQMSKFKVGNPWKAGKTSSEREIIRCWGVAALQSLR